MSKRANIVSTTPITFLRPGWCSVISDFDLVLLFFATALRSGIHCRELRCAPHRADYLRPEDLIALEVAAMNRGRHVEAATGEVVHPAIDEGLENLGAGVVLVLGRDQVPGRVLGVRRGDHVAQR